MEEFMGIFFNKNKEKTIMDALLALPAKIEQTLDMDSMIKRVA